MAYESGDRREPTVPAEGSRDPEARGEAAAVGSPADGERETENYGRQGDPAAREAVAGAEPPLVDETPPRVPEVEEPAVSAPAPGNRGEPLSRPPVAEPRESRGVPPPLEPPQRDDNRSGCMWALLATLASLVLVPLVVLAILYLLNGTLTFTRSRPIQDLQTRTSDLQRRAEDLAGQVETLNGRAGAAEQELRTLDSLAEQFGALSSEQESLQAEIADLQQGGSTVRADLAAAEQRLREVEELLQGLRVYFAGLRDLLLTIEPLSTGSAGSPTGTSTRALTPTVSSGTGTPAATPATRSPAPTATPGAGRTGTPAATPTRSPAPTGTQPAPSPTAGAGQPGATSTPTPTPLPTPTQL